MLVSLVAVAVGGALGCICRWLLGIGLNLLFPAIPPGTLAANLIGAYLVGMALAYFGTSPDVAPQWRLLVITGFLGGLTTFSSFSGETAVLLRDGKLAMAGAAIGLHLGGSLLLTFAGMATASVLRRH
ncbi:fluoride efflux transporter CrcB [Ramlibacter sp.]|uniref:fluoride efflux transporter CrcB n=1 Tax=Ramlibacter sp. TaxID=1917967 RepID=UPI002FC9DB63